MKKIDIDKLDEITREKLLEHARDIEQEVLDEDYYDENGELI